MSDCAATFTSWLQIENASDESIVLDLRTNICTKSGMGCLGFDRNMRLVLTGLAALCSASLAAVTKSAFAQVPSPAPRVEKAADKLPYGSRAGMQVTITGREGIDTQHAVIHIGHFRSDAEAYCRQYEKTSAKECIDHEMMQSFPAQIMADCTTGDFTNLSGKQRHFAGPNPSGSLPYIIMDSEAGLALDGSSAGGFDIDLAQFRALCPSLVDTHQTADQMDASPTTGLHEAAMVSKDALSTTSQTARIAAINAALADPSTVETTGRILECYANGYEYLQSGMVLRAKDHDSYEVALLQAGGFDRLARMAKAMCDKSVVGELIKINPAEADIATVMLFRRMRELQGQFFEDCTSEFCKSVREALKRK